MFVSTSWIFHRGKHPAVHISLSGRTWNFSNVTLQYLQWVAPFSEASLQALADLSFSRQPALRVHYLARETSPLMILPCMIESKWELMFEWVISLSKIMYIYFIYFSSNNPILLDIIHDVKSWLIRKDPGVGKDWKQEENGTTEEKMVGWHHRLNGHEFEQVLGDGEGEVSLACCSLWGYKESDMTEKLNNKIL